MKVEPVGINDHPYYSLKNRFVGFNLPEAEKSVNAVGTVQVPTPESTRAPHIPEIGKGSLKDVYA